ncbi:MAG: hypothetical protein JO266_21905 [Acidobacteria bacterium]|nr:hypothetical protein [Acidobacteriota bacterium]
MSLGRIQAMSGMVYSLPQSRTIQGSGARQAEPAGQAKPTMPRAADSELVFRKSGTSERHPRAPPAQQ